MLVHQELKQFVATCLFTALDVNDSGDELVFVRIFLFFFLHFLILVRLFFFFLFLFFFLIFVFGIYLQEASLLFDDFNVTFEELFETYLDRPVFVFSELCKKVLVSLRFSMLAAERIFKVLEKRMLVAEFDPVVGDL